MAARRDDTVIRVGCVLVGMARYCPAGRFMPVADPVRGGRAGAVRRRSVKSAFKVWSKHRIAVVQAAHPAVPPLAQRQPSPGTPGTAAAAVKPKLVECQHYAPNVTAVLDQVTGERLAWYCQACDQQLAANWALSEGEALPTGPVRRRR